MLRKASLMRLLGAQVAIGFVVTRKSTNAQRTAHVREKGMSRRYGRERKVRL